METKKLGGNHSNNPIELIVHLVITFDDDFLFPFG